MVLYIEKLKTIRKQKKISSDELAQKAGISRVTLSAWENAKRIPSEAKIRMLANVLDIPVNEISDLDPDKTISKVNLTVLGSSINSIVNGGKDKDINRHKNLVSGMMGLLKELSNAKLIIGAMISSLPSIFYIKGSDLKYMTASETFLKSQSLSKNFDVAGKTDYDFFPENEAKINAEMDKEVLACGKSILDKEGYIPGTRKTRWSIFSKIPIYDSEGNIEGLLGFFKDITERRLAEKKIADNNKLLQDMIDNSSSLIYIFDIEGRFVSVNHEVEKLFGKSKNEIIGKTRESFIPEEIAKLHHLNDLEVINARRSILFEEENLQQDGKHFYITSKIPLIDNQNVLYGVAGISSDITESKLAHAALLLKEEEYRTLAENSPDLIARFDKQLRHIYVNSAAASLGSLPPDEYIGKNMADVGIPESVRSIWDERIQKVFDSGELLDVVDSFPARDGLHYFHTRLVPERAADGNVLSVMTLARDITDRKRMEDKLHEALQQLNFHVENTPLAVVQFNNKYQITKWSDKAEKMFGWSADEVLGKRIQEFKWVYEEDRETIAVISADMLNRNKPGNFNVNRNYRKDGSVITCEWYNSALTDSGGGLVSVYSLINDITERTRADEELRERELFFRESQQAASIGSYKNDLLSGLWESSEVLDQIFGIDKNYNRTVQGWLDIVHPDDREMMEQLFLEEVIAKRKPFSKEYRIIRKSDGAVRWVKDMGKVNFVAEDCVISMIGTVQDITGQKQTETALLESNAYLENLINYANAPIIIWDPLFRITRFNHAFEFLTGRSEAEVLGQSLEILFPVAATYSMELIRMTLTGERWESVEIEILHRDGSTRTVLWNSATLFAADGQTPVATIAQGQDITARKRAESELRGREEQFRNLANSGMVLLWATGTDRLCSYVNEPWLKFTGRSLEQEMGNGWMEGIHPDDFDRCLDTFVTAFDKREAFELEYRMRHASGEYRWLLDKGAPNYNSKGEFIGFIGHCFDISEHKQADQEIKLNNAEPLKPNAPKNKLFSIPAGKRVNKASPTPGNVKKL
ncbi:MAG: PAS domain S-box protein [Victivallaceae bacterium]